MSIYDDLKVVASGILNEFNQGGIKLVHVSVSDNSTPDEPQTIETVYNLVGTVKGGDFRYDKDGFIATAEKEVIVGVLDGVQPSENDFIELNGYRYKIVKDLSVPGVGTKCVWKFLISKGE